MIDTQTASTSDWKEATWDLRTAHFVDSVGDRILESAVIVLERQFDEAEAAGWEAEYDDGALTLRPYDEYRAQRLGRQTP